MAGWALVVSAAITLSLSCGKETPCVIPPGTLVRPPEEKKEEPPSIQAAAGELLLGYPEEIQEVPFLISGHGEVVAEIQAEGAISASCELSRDGRSGTVLLGFPEEKDARGHVTLTLRRGALSSELSFGTKTYRFGVTADPVALPFFEGACADLVFSLDTDLPDCQLVIAPEEGAFFSVEGGSLQALETNPLCQERTSSAVLSEASGRLGAFRVPVIQGALPEEPGKRPVPFQDAAFRSAVLPLSDADGNGVVSYEEALGLGELVLPGKGIRDLTGLPAFRNLWKLDLRDNDISDAGCLKELPLLHWLDLKGNRNLRTFDVTGCTQYFEHCEFQLTPDLSYYTFRQQVGIINASDPSCSRSHHVPDTRTSRDYSNHGKVVKVQEHTEGSGAAPSIVFSGLGYLDVDYRDGSWRRLMDDVMDAFWRASPIASRREWFDVYYVEWVDGSRNRYYCPELADPSGDEYWAAMTTYGESLLALSRHCYESINGPSGEVPQLAVFVNNNPEKAGLFSGSVRSACYPTDVAHQYSICLFTHSRIGADLSGVEQEGYYSAAGGDTRSLLPEGLFTHPAVYTEDSREWERQFLGICGL